MAIRLNGATAFYRTANLLNLDANYSLSFWLYVIARPGTENYSVLWQQNPGAGNSIDSYNILKIDASTAYFNIYTLTGAGGFNESTASTNIALNTWYHIGIIRSANNSRILYVNGTAHVTHSTSLSGRTASTEMDMGVTIVNPGDYLDGRLAHIKIWSAALTATQIANEGYYAVPLVTTSLNQWHPTFSGATERLADYSGNGRNWTASGTLSDEDGPPVAWAPPIVIMPFPASVSSAQTVTPSGITSAEAFGTTAIAPGAVAVAPSAIASAEAFGSTTVSAAASEQTISPSGIASSEAFGSATIQPGAVTITPTAITSVEAHGTAVLAVGAVTVAPAGIASSFATGTTQVLMAACIGGVLVQNSANGRYFENDAGPLVLAGSHTWYNAQDGDTTYPPDPFEWDDYLSRLTGHRHNFTLLWRLEAARDWPSDNTQRFGVQPYARTGPGNAADGQPKFDLDTWDNDYFDRLLQRAVTAGNAGFYVGVMLFQGFHIDATKNGTPTGDPWAYHPFQNGNNINSVDGDIDNDGIGEELRDTAQTALYNRSKAFVEKVIDTLGHLDNVIWEIENEGGTYSVAWQHALIDYIHTYEAGKPKQHPVGMVKCYPGGSNTDLTTSNANWISPDDDLAPDAVTSTAQIRAYDTDHSVGDTDTFDWVFRALTRGYGGIWYMDPWYGTSTGDTRDNATYELIRATLGYALDYAGRLDLEGVTPQGSLSSTGYCIAKLTGVAQLLAYQDSTGNFTVNLTSVSGTFTVEWLRISNGTVQAGSDVTGGAVRTLTPPWSGEVVAFLELAELLIAPSGIASEATFGTATIVPGAITISCTGIASAEAFGSAVVQPGAVTVAPNGVATAEAFGTASTQPGAVTVAPDGVATTEAFGTALVQAGESYIAPTGIASGEAHGSATVLPGAVSILPTGIVSDETHGETLLATGAVLQPAGIASGEAHGTTTVQPGAVSIVATGIDTAESFGTAALLVDLLVAAAGIATGEAFGTTLLSVGGAFIQATGIASGETFGDLVVLPGAVSILPAGIAGGEAFGTLRLVVAGADQYIDVPSVQDGETFGIATLLMALIAERTFSVRAETRRYVVVAENRTYSVQR